MDATRTILVPLDFSEVSSHALDYAIELAQTLGASLHLVHALHVQALMTPGGDWWEGVRSAALDGLQAAQEQAEAAGCSCKTELSDAYPVDAILGAARANQVDMIVMGTRGYTGLKHVLLGSIAERTLRQAPCPVITLHGDGERQQEIAAH